MRVIADNTDRKLKPGMFVTITLPDTAASTVLQVLTTSPSLGPIATGMSEIYQFEVRAKPGYEYDQMELRTILDWQIAFQLRSVPGVIEVNTFGGQLKTYEIQVDPDRLLNYGISLSKVFTALEENNGNAGGGAIARGEEQRLIRGEGLVEDLDDIRTIVIIVFLPILSLEGVEAKMFRPMAFTFMSAMTGALILSVTVMPVMASLFLARRVSEKDTFLVRWCKALYRPLLTVAMRHPVLMIGSSVAAFAASVVLASTFGLEFVPKLDEGDLAIQATRLPSVSLATSVEMTKAMERTLLKFPQVESVVSKTGRPEIANDPMGVHQTDVFVKLKAPDGHAVEPYDKNALIEEMHAALEAEVPGNA